MIAETGMPSVYNETATDGQLLCRLANCSTWQSSVPGFIYTPLGVYTPLLYEHTPLAMTPNSPDRLSCMFVDTLYLSLKLCYLSLKLCLRQDKYCR